VYILIVEKEITMQASLWRWLSFGLELIFGDSVKRLLKNKAT